MKPEQRIATILMLKKIQKARSQGLVRTCEIQFNRFVPPWIFRYSKGDIFDLDIQKLKDSAANLDVDDQLLVRSVTSEHERSLLREFTWNSVPLETTRNDIGYVIFDKRQPEKFLGGLWAGIESFSEHNLGIKFRFAEHQAWLYCAYVHGDARGRGVYKRLISHVAADLENRGFTQLLGIVQPWNKISKLMHEKNSNGILGRMSAVRTGPFVWITSSGAVTVDRSLVTNAEAIPALVAIA